MQRAQRKLAAFAAARPGWTRIGFDPCIAPPVFMALGVLAFMAAPQAVGTPAALLIIAAALAARWASRRHIPRPGLAWLAALAAWAVLGWGASAWRIDRVDAPIMPDYARGYDVTGWVSRVDPGSRPGVVIEVTGFSGDDETQTPQRIRVRTPRPAPALGQGVTGRVSLMAPPGPATPGGYDFSRKAWFDRISGTGFSYGRLRPADVETRGLAAAGRAIARIRGRLADRIRDAAPSDSGAVIAALLTGERSAIPLDVSEKLRISGLGHLLAISGLHMALVGGGVFFVITLGLALIEPLSRRHDVRKPAAIAALIVSALYLVLAGHPVSAQRAFIMLGVAFLALIFDRRALTLRNVAVAAVVVLFFTPEALLEAGFQMSFAAAAALVAAFEFAQNRGEGRRWPAPISFFTTLSTTSLVAGAATAAFAAFHFNRWAAYGFLANLAAMPLFTLLVMPAAVIGVVLTPLGLDGVFYRLAAGGMDWVLTIAGRASDAPHALAFAPAGQGWALFIYAAGFILLIAGRNALRIAGVTVMAVGLAAWFSAPRPVLFISDQGVVAALEGENLYASNLRRSKYGVEQFARRLGRNPEGGIFDLKERLICDSDACVGTVSGLRLALVSGRRALKEECARSDLVVFSDPAAARTLHLCGANLLDSVTLNRTQGVAFYPKEGGFDVKTARESRWNPPKR